MLCRPGVGTRVESLLMQCCTYLNGYCVHWRNLFFSTNRGVMWRHNGMYSAHKMGIPTQCLTVTETVMITHTYRWNIKAWNSLRRLSWEAGKAMQVVGCEVTNHETQPRDTPTTQLFWTQNDCPESNASTHAQSPLTLRSQSPVHVYLL